jgi:hypothetical protein
MILISFPIIEIGLAIESAPEDDGCLATVPLIVIKMSCLITYANPSR